MFTKFPDQLWQTLESAYEIAVMLRILQRCAFDGNGVCYETRDNMAAACGISQKTWTQVIADLERKRLIIVSRAHRAPHQITLGDDVKTILEGKNDLQKINTIFCESNLPPKKKPKRKPRVDYNNVTEVERIHAKWLKNKDKGKPDCT